MLITTLTIITLIAGDPPPPANLPAALEVCIEQAETCATKATADGVDHGALNQCIAEYEDCSYDFDEAHEPACQLERVWCALEIPFSIELGINPDAVEYCRHVYATCPG